MIAGVAIDKNKDNDKYVLTAEVINPKGETNAKITPDLMQMEGETIFDAARTMIMRTGKRIYWSHAKTLIISEEIAREGIADILDFLNRDAETRADMYLIISQEKTAAELLKGKDNVHDIISFHILDAMTNIDSVSKYAVVKLWQFIKDLSSEGISATIPTAVMVQDRDSIVPQITGTAVFKRDKMVGWLDAIESRSMLTIKGKINKGFVMAVNISKNTKATLEITEIKTKLKPEIKNNEIVMDIAVTVVAGIAEVMGAEDIISKDGRQKTVIAAEKTINKQLEDTLKKVQQEYKSDVFGFGSVIRREMPGVWKKIKPNWEETFANMDTNISVTVEIKHSALTSKTIKVGD